MIFLKKETYFRCHSGFEFSVFILYFEKLCPNVEQPKPPTEHNVPICHCHLKIESLLSRVLCIVERKLVKFFEFIIIAYFFLKRWELPLELFNAITAEKIC